MDKQDIFLDQKQYDLDISHHVSRRVNISSIFLAEATCSRIKMWEKPKSYDFEVALESNEVEVDEKSNSIYVIPVFELQGFACYEEKKKEIYKVRTKFVLSYKSDSLEGFTKEHYEAFSNINAIFNVWPYWREEVNSATLRMSVPPLTLPFFRLLPTERSDTAEGGTENQ